MAGNKGISRRQQRKGRTEKNKTAIHFQTVRAGGFEETQVICYLWDLVKLLEAERDTPSRDRNMQTDVECQQKREVEMQIRSRVRVEMRRYFMRQKRRSVKLVIRTLAIMAVIIIFFTCVLGVDRVNGDSMYPYLNHGDWIVYSRIKTAAKRNDVIVFEKNGENLVKRVAGLPGDTVKISASGGRVVVNGIQVREPYVTLTGPEPDGMGTGMGAAQTVMDGQYLVLGDNRSISIDSRDSNMGTVAAGDILGRGMFVIRAGW